MDITFLAAIAGGLVAALFEWFPKLNDKFNQLEPGVKQLIMLGLMSLVGAGIYLLSCEGILDYLPCGRDGVLKLASLIFAAILGNQGSHRAINRIGKTPTDEEALAMAEADAEVEGGQ